MAHAHDSSFALPFPQLPIRLRQLGGSSATSALTALIDTGADITLVPSIQLAAIQADEIYTASLRSHWGEGRSVSVFLVDLEIAGQLLPGIEVVADSQGQEILLGRNVTNKLILLLDGPRLESDVLTNRP